MKITVLATMLMLAAQFAPGALHGAIQLDDGPGYPPPGGVAFSSDGNSMGRAGGQTRTYSGLDLAATAELYFGIANDALSGLSMDFGPITADERYGATFVSGDPTEVSWLGTSAGRPTRLTISVTDGTAAWLTDATTLALSSAIANPEWLLHINSSSFQVNILVEAHNLSGFWDPYLDVFDSLPMKPQGSQAFNSLTTAFYWQENSVAPPATAITPEPATMTIWALGAIGCAMVGYRRKQSAKHVA